jgi:hypothetical protein
MWGMKEIEKAHNISLYSRATLTPGAIGTYYWSTHFNPPNEIGRQGSGVENPRRK